MKKTICLFAIAFGLVSTNCILLDETGLSDSMKGTEAKQKISDVGFAADVWAYGLVYSPEQAPGLAAVDKTFVELFVKIEDSKYYLRADVTRCAADIRHYVTLFISDASTTTLISKNCSGLKPNGLLYR